MMSPRAIQDVDALELGFLADGILQAIKALTTGGGNERHYGWLREGVQLLTGLAAGVGPAPAATEQQLQFASLASFPFAAEALKTVRSTKVSDGLRNYFGLLADTLKRLIEGISVSPEDIDRVCDFFKAIAQATREHSIFSQSPTLLGPERIPWRTF
jgi:hypothetical protein